MTPSVKSPTLPRPVPNNPFIIRPLLRPKTRAIYVSYPTSPCTSAVTRRTLAPPQTNRKNLNKLEHIVLKAICSRIDLLRTAQSTTSDQRKRRADELKCLQRGLNLFAIGSSGSLLLMDIEVESFARKHPLKQ